MFERSRELSSWLIILQNKICKGLQELDGKSEFSEDKWERQEGGGGISRVIADGNIFEKGGVNFSHVFGKTPAFLAQETTLFKAHDNPDQDNTFSATGVSIVIHPQNPFVPIIHMNIRFFEMSNGTYWFGGGIDLTPHYFSEDVHEFFHHELKKMCNIHHDKFYHQFSKWADEYFFITHRGESRGIGGIFFDRLSETNELKFDKIQEFWKSTGELFLPLYMAIVNHSKNKKYTAENKQWQMLRRGRYVEFNLVYDRGTKFGLETGGRIESILMSLPKHASWFYDFKPEEGSPEEKTLKWLKRKDNRIID